jgi:putative endonuclease
MTSHSIGMEAEALALDFLKNKGLILVEQNFHGKRGEIDLVMEHDSHLVFVEVRYRKSAKFGNAIESVTIQKQRRIIATAERFIQQCSKPYSHYRFDVVAIEKPLSNESITWIQDAFQLS